MKDIRFCFLVYSVIRIGPTLIPNSLKQRKNTSPYPPVALILHIRSFKGAHGIFFSLKEFQLMLQRALISVVGMHVVQYLKAIRIRIQRRALTSIFRQTDRKCIFECHISLLLLIFRKIRQISIRSNVLLLTSINTTLAIFRQF